jgi:S1-C subfamily serine protease
MKNIIYLSILMMTCLKVLAQDSVKSSTDNINLQKLNYDKSLKNQLQFQFDIKKAFQNQSLQKENLTQSKAETMLQKVVVSVSEARVVSVSEAEIESDSERNHRKMNYINGPTQFDSRIETLRLDPKDISQFKILQNTFAVGMIVEKGQIHRVADSIYQLDIPMTLGQKFNLCPSEPFANQPAAGIATCFVTGSNEMVTAGHVFTGALSNYVVIFNFKIINKAGAYNPLILAKYIYYPSKIKYTDSQLDVTIFSTDRSIKTVPLKCSFSSNLTLNTPVYMIGYPSGLPQKVALNAEVSVNSNPEYIYTSLDAFQGNSGSPVFNLNTNMVIGLLVSGGTDLRPSGNCNVSTLCKIPYCLGEKVVKIALLKDHISQ